MREARQRRHRLDEARSQRRVACALGRAHPSWPLTSAVYNRNYSDQSHSAHKTFPTRQSQTTPLQYPSQSQSTLLQPSHQRQESLSKSQRVLQHRANKPPDRTVIGSVKNWARLIKLSSSIASIKTERERDIGSDGALTCPIDNGLFLIIAGLNLSAHHLFRLQLGKTIRGTATHGHISPMSTPAHGHTDGEKTALQVSATTTSVSASPLLYGTRMTGC
jgi:hypothetical protein